MGLLTKIEDRPTPKAVYNWHVYISAATASLASFMIGYTSSFIGTSVTLTSFEHEFGFQNMTSSRVTNIKANIVSFFQVGAIFGSLLAYITAFYIGRKKSLWIFTVIFLLGAGVTLDAKNGNLGPMYAGRVISGLGVGGCTMVVSNTIYYFTVFILLNQCAGSYLSGRNCTSSYSWSPRWLLRTWMANWRSSWLLDQLRH